MRKIYIKLKRAGRNIAGDYVLDQLRNAASVGVDPRREKTTILRVGDSVSQLQADTLCEIEHYEVTITN